MHEEMNKRETFISGGWMMCERLLRLSCGGAMDGRDWGWGSLREGGRGETDSVCKKGCFASTEKKKGKKKCDAFAPKLSHAHRYT